VQFITEDQYLERDWKPTDFILSSKDLPDLMDFCLELGRRRQKSLEYYSMITGEYYE